MRQNGILYVFVRLSGDFVCFYQSECEIKWNFVRQSGILYVFASLNVRHSEVLYVFGSISGVFVFLVRLSVKQSG